MDGLIIHNVLAQQQQLANRHNNNAVGQLHIQMDQPSQLPIAAAVKKLDGASQLPHDIK